MNSSDIRPLRIVGYGFLAFALTTITGGVWSALLIVNLRSRPELPWSVGVMAVLLVLVWKYLKGAGWPRSTAAARRRDLRGDPVSAAVWCWALAAGALAIASLTGLWIVLVRIVSVPPHALPDFSRYPATTVALALVMSSAVGAVTEEAGFRGYFQGALESRFGAIAAIAITALVMAPVHALSQGFVWPVLVFYVTVDVMLGAMAALCRSILPGIVVHAAGLFVFFEAIWPHDAERLPLRLSGGDADFWLDVCQAAICAALAFAAFFRLRRVAEQQRLLRG